MSQGKETIRALTETMIDEAIRMDEDAALLDGWAKESRSGGWSTHQVESNINKANDLRRRASNLRGVAKIGKGLKS